MAGGQKERLATIEKTELAVKLSAQPGALLYDLRRLQRGVDDGVGNDADGLSRDAFAQQGVPSRRCRCERANPMRMCSEKT